MRLLVNDSGNVPVDILGSLGHLLHCTVKPSCRPVKLCTAMSIPLACCLQKQKCQDFFFCGRIIKHHLDKHDQLSCTGAVHRLLALDAKPPALQIPVQLLRQVFRHSRHSSNSRAFTQSDVGESGDGIGTLFLVFEHGVSNLHHCFFQDLPVRKGLCGSKRSFSRLL